MSDPGTGENQPMSEAEIVNGMVSSRTEGAASDARARADISGDPEVTMSDQEKIGVISSLLESVPGVEVSKEQRDAVATTIVELGDRDTIDQTEADHFAEELSAYNRSQAEQIVNNTNLTDDSKQKIISSENFPEMMSDEDRARTEEEDQPTDAERADKSGALTKLENTTNQVTQQTLAAIDANGDLTDAEKATLRTKAHNLGAKITDFFAEGEPARDYARKGGKILYYALLTAVIILLLEMNIIYKAAGRKK